MSNEKVDRFSRGVVLESIDDSDTSIRVNYPSPYETPTSVSGADGFLVITDSYENPTSFEIVLYNVDNVTQDGFDHVISSVTRGQQGTISRAWPAGSFIAQDITTDIQFLDSPNPPTGQDHYLIFGDSVYRHSDKKLLASSLDLPSANLRTYSSSPENGIIFVALGHVSYYSSSMNKKWSQALSGWNHIWRVDPSGFWVGAGSSSGELKLLSYGDGSEIDATNTNLPVGTIVQVITDSLGRSVVLQDADIVVVNESYQEFARATPPNWYNVGAVARGHLAEVPGIGYLVRGGDLYDYSLNLIDSIPNVFDVMGHVGQGLMYVSSSLSSNPALLEVSSRQVVWTQTGGSADGVSSDAGIDAVYGMAGGDLFRVKQYSLEDGSILWQSPIQKSGTQDVQLLPINTDPDSLFINNYTSVEQPVTSSTKAIPGYRMIKQSSASDIGTVPAGKARLWYDGTSLKARLDDQTDYTLATK